MTAWLLALSLSHAQMVLVSGGVTTNPAPQATAALGVPAWRLGFATERWTAWGSAQYGSGQLDGTSVDRFEGWALRPRVGFMTRGFGGGRVVPYATASLNTVLGGASTGERARDDEPGTDLVVGATGGAGLDARLSTRCSIAIELGGDALAVRVSAGDEVGSAFYVTSFGALHLNLWI